jgi:hypothetical protein
MRARERQEYYVANNKNPNERRPGEKEPGTFHYNPGNMSGKTVGSHKDDADSNQTPLTRYSIATKNNKTRRINNISRTSGFRPFATRSTSEASGLKTPAMLKRC